MYTGGSDPDARSRRRESITAGAAAVFDQIGDARHFVIVSSALVYGAWANNPVPLTEDAVLRPDVEFAFAASARGGRAVGRHVADRPAGPHGDGPAPGHRDGGERDERTRPRVGGRHGTALR